MNRGLRIIHEQPRIRAISRSRSNRLFTRGRERSKRQSHARGKQRICSFLRKFLLSKSAQTRRSSLQLSKEARVLVVPLLDAEGEPSRYSFLSHDSGTSPGLSSRPERSLPVVSIVCKENRARGGPYTKNRSCRVDFGTWASFVHPATRWSVRESTRDAFLLPNTVSCMPVLSIIESRLSSYASAVITADEIHVNLHFN